MKATFFTLATMAASAFAAPAPAPVLDGILGGIIPSPSGAPAAPSAAPAVADSPLAGLIPSSGSKESRQLPDASSLGSAADLQKVLSGLVDQLKGNFGNIKDITGKVDSGETTPEEAEPGVQNELKKVEETLKNLVTELTGQAGLPVADGDVDRLLVVVNGLLDVVLTNVNGLVTILGLRPQLVSILHSVFTLLANLLTAVTGLVSALLPGLIAALTPLLATLGNGLLAGILTPLAGLLAGISGP